MKIYYNEGFTEKFDGDYRTAFHNMVEEQAHEAVKSGKLTCEQCYDLSTVVSRASFVYSLWNEATSGFASDIQARKDAVKSYVETLREYGLTVTVDIYGDVETYILKKYPNQYEVY